MLYYLVDAAVLADSLARVLLQALVDKVFAVFGHGNTVLLCIWEEHGLCLDQLVHFIVVWLPRVERRKANNHLIGKDPKGPPVHRECMANLFQDFWRKVLRCAAERVRLLILLEDLGEAEIGQADISIFAHENVFRLQISINDLLLVEMPESQGDCERIELRTLLRKLPRLSEVHEQLASSHKLHDKEDLLLSLEHVLHAN